MNSASYPIFLDLQRKPILIVGGGSVGLRKARGLISTGARITVVSVDFAEGFSDLTDVECITAAYAATHMSRKMWRLVFAATNHRSVNDQVQKHAAAHGILCCRCDEPELGDFSGGATWVSESRQITIAVGTSGASPLLAARIRDSAAAAVDPVLVTWAELMSGWRPRIRKELGSIEWRRELFMRTASEEMESALRAGGKKAAEALFEQWLGALCNRTPLNTPTKNG